MQARRRGGRRGGATARCRRRDGLRDVVLAILELGLGTTRRPWPPLLAWTDDTPLVGTRASPTHRGGRPRGQQALAEEALARFAERARATGTPLALRAAGLDPSAGGAGPGEQYEEALELLRPSGAVQIARAHLLYGEWLRRQPPSRGGATSCAAHDMFEALHLDAFAGARRRLRATGEHARRRQPRPSER